MNDLRTQLAKWVTTEVTASIRMQYGDRVADDLARVMREYFATLKSDQMVMRMAADIRNKQIQMEKLLTNAQYTAVYDDEKDGVI